MLLMKRNNASISDLEKDFEDFERMESAQRNADWNSIRCEKFTACK